MLNFGQKVQESDNSIIPKDALLWAVINIREMKKSRETNGEYLDIELTIADNQPYARRKIWIMVANPFDGNNSEEWRTMGYGAIRRILEAVKGATPDNANSYVLNQLQDLHGWTVPIITTIEKGKDGYGDKNKAEFLSPHSSVKKIVECFRLLHSGVFTYAKAEKPSAPGQGSMFTGTQNPPPAAMAHTPAATPANNAPSFLAPLPAAGQPAHVPPAQPQAFTAGQSAQHQVAPVSAVVHQPPASTPQLASPVAPAAGTSPSNQQWQPPGALPAQFPNGNQ